MRRPSSCDSRAPPPDRNRRPCSLLTTPPSWPPLHAPLTSFYFLWQILRFSPLAENASYRPLVGGVSLLPLAVHAWKYGFNADFLRKEMPRRRNPSNSRKTLNETVSLGDMYGSKPSNALDGSAESGAGARGSAAHDKATLGHASNEDNAGPTAKEGVDWGNLACSWVFGDSMQSKRLTKRYRTALREEWFLAIQLCDAWKLFGPAYWYFTTLQTTVIWGPSITCSHRPKSLWSLLPLLFLNSLSLYPHRI